MIKKILKIGFIDFKNNIKVVHQTGMLFIVQIITLIIGVVLKGFQTKALGPEGYGVFAFFISITGFTVLFFRFGIFSSVRVLLAHNNDSQREREIFGAGMIYGLIIGICFSLFIYFISFFIDKIFRVNVNSFLRMFSPLCFVLPFQFLVSEMATGSNLIHIRAKYILFTNVLFILPVAFFFYIGKLTLNTLISSFLVSNIISLLFIVREFNPSMCNIRLRIREILHTTMEYGKKVYFGQIATQVTYKLDQLFIGYFVNTLWVGYYSLILTITYPITILSSALGQSIHKDLAGRKKIPSKIIYYNLLLLVFSILLILSMGKYVILILFSDKFLPSISLILPLSVAVFFQGMYQPYIQYLSANKKGLYQRNAAILSGFCSVLMNIILIPQYGAYGAAVASAISMAVTFSINLFYYRKTTKYMK